MKKLLILMSLLIGFSPAFAENIDSIFVVCDEWKNYTNKDGTGAYWEVLKSVYEPVGIDVTTKTMPWKRVLMMVKKKKADALVGDYYDAKSADYLYPTWHISVEDPVVAVFKKGTIKNWENTGIRSLEGKRVVWIRGYDFEINFLKGIHVIQHEITTIPQGLRLIDSGRDDVFLDYESSVRHEAKKLHFNLDQDYEIKRATPGNKLYVVFAKTETSKELVRIFDRRMTLLAETGEIEKIYLKWGLEAKKFGKERFGTE